MSTKVKIDGRVIRETREAQKLSRQKLCNLGAEQKKIVGRASIERMEAAKPDQFFAYDTVKIVADLLDINIGKIVQVETQAKESFTKLNTARLNSGNELTKILLRTDKLIVRSYAEPDDIQMQNFILETAAQWDQQSKATQPLDEPLYDLKNTFEKKNQLSLLSKSGIHLYHASTYQVAYFDIDGDEVTDESGEQTAFISRGPVFSSMSYLEKKAADSHNYGFDFDGVGAQQVDYLVLSDDEEAPLINHHTNPFGFPEGTLEAISETYDRLKRHDDNQISSKKAAK